MGHAQRRGKASEPEALRRPRPILARVGRLTIYVKNLEGGTTLHRILLASAFAIAALGSLATVETVAIAAPNPGPAQIVNDEASPIIAVDRRCGRGRHYVPRHRVRDRYGHLHWIAGHCIRNR